MTSDWIIKFLALNNKSYIAVADVSINLSPLDLGVNLSFEAVDCKEEFGVGSKQQSS